MLWIGGGFGRELVVIWQPVQLEREITIGARACVADHLSASHRNDSRYPVGSHYFTTLLSWHPAGGKHDESYWLYKQTYMVIG